jgi:hypothetical protein
MIQTASFVGLVKTILILLLAYSIFKYVMRLLSPWIIRSVARKMAQKFNQPPPNYSSQNEGDKSVDKTEIKQRPKQDVGEYVDYEELD